MIGSRCVAGHGAWLPPRERCPACAGPVEPIDVPDVGDLLASTSVGGHAVGLVQLGDAAVPVIVEGPVPEGAGVVVVARPDGLLVARPRP